MYLPEQNLSIDEQMIGTKSGISFTQYMPKKPKKFYIKVWVLCEADYCLQFQRYTGKSETEGAENGLSYRVVFDLMHNYLDKNFHVYFDYKSYKLVNDLKNKSTFSCGTTHVDRGLFPIEFKKSKLEKNKFLEDGNIVAVHRKDKHDIYAMSAISGSEIELVERQNNDLVEKPRII